ncbi:MAG: response regulator [Candidatus Sumerlaeota bacterium]
MQDETQNRRRNGEHYAEALRKMTRRHDQLVQGLSILRQIDDFDDPTLDIDTIFGCLLDTLSYGLGAENCSLMLLDSSERYMELRAACSPLEDGSRVYKSGDWEGRRFRLGEGVVGKVAQTGKAYRIDDAAREVDFLSVPESPVKVRSLLCYPLTLGNKTIGVLNLSHARPGVFALETEGVLALVARRVTRLLGMHVLYERIRKSEEHYRLVSENAGDGVLVFNRKGDVLNANPAVEWLTGLMPEQLISGETRWGDLVHPEDLPEYEERRKKLLAEERSYIFSYRLNDHAGRTHYVEERASLLQGMSPSDEGPEIVTVVRDVSERQRATEALEAASRMEAAATLAGGIAHDFNNLMTAVLGNAELLSLKFEDESRARRQLDDISRAAERAGHLAQQMLAFARGGRYHLGTINLNQVVRDSIRIDDRAASEKIVVRRRLAPNLWHCKADPVQIGQVVVHLVDNALEAMPKGGSLTISTTNLELDLPWICDYGELEAGKPYVCLSIHDTGEGMDEETRRRVFEPFFTRKFQGRGLGLAAVYGIINHHEGMLCVDSEVDVGSTFEFYLPAVEALPTKAPEEIPSASEEGELILVVDDEDIILSITREILDSLGYQSISAHNGKEAVEKVREFHGKIRLVLLDLGMPVMSGVEAFPHMKEIDPDVKVVICSGYERDASIQDLLEQGARDFIQKPFSKRTLAETVRRVIDEK